jgi:transcription antitermination factor NusG
MPILPAEPDMFPEHLWEGVAEDEGGSARRWYCLHTKPRQEKATARDLRARAVPFYLPQMIREDRTPAGRKISSLLPLFSSYLFLFGDEMERLVALKGNRLVRVIDVVDQEGLDRDLRQIHRMLSSGLAIEPEPTAELGSRVRIASGPLTGLEGIVVRRGKHNHFVAVVQMLGLGATVALEDWQVEVLAG